MRNTVDAVRYGIETLGVTPEEMFSLLESSNGYTGDDYNRWLANEIIKIAEKDGIGYSQLLVKKFSIIQSMSEESDATIKESAVQQFKNMIGCENIHSINFDYLGKSMEEEIDWLNGVDYDEVNSYFVDEVLPQDVADGIMNKEPIAFVTRLSSSSADKGSDMFKSSKELNLNCKNEGSLMLYRMCSIVDTFDSDEKFKFAFLVNVDFLTDKENARIIDYFLRHFSYEGLVLKSNELFEDSYLSNSFAFIVCTPRQVDSEKQDCFKLISSEGEKTYSRTSESLLDKILNDCESTMYMGSDICGYMNISNTNKLSLSDERVEKAKYSIPISIKNNLKDIVIYYSVVKSLGFFGLSSEVLCPMTGHSMYNKLFYSCLPMFLYDDDNKISGIHNEEIWKNLLTEGEVYYSYESKELITTCKGFMDFLENQGNLDKDESFDEIRKDADHSELNELYISSLRNLKDYIKALYREIE